MALVAVLLWGQRGHLWVHHPLVEWQEPRGSSGAGPRLRWFGLFQGELYRMCQEGLDCDPSVAEVLVAHPDLLGDR